MNDRIFTNIKIIHKEGADLGYYLEKKEFFNNIVGVKDKTDNSEFIERGKIFEHNGKKLKVDEISIKLQNLKWNKENKPRNFSEIETIIFVEYID